MPSNSISPRRYRDLPTERPNRAAFGIDARPLRQVLRLINREDARVPRAVAKELPRLERAVRLIEEAWRRGGRVVFIGAGTSGRLGVLEAAECPPTFGTPPARIRAFMAGGRRAVFKALEGAEDDPEEGASRLRRWARPGDVVVGVAASGVTPFVRGALRAARRAKLRTILVTSNTSVSRPVEADVVIAPDVGPEILAGSTRLKSASAAKLVLNSLTTAAMIRLGKVHDHRMVDLRPNSYKLAQRALRIVAEMGRVPPPRAKVLLAQAGGSVKTAVVMARLGLGARVARGRLRRGGGRLRDVLDDGV